MDGKRLIRSIKLTNLLSFGPDGMEIELQPLNVLIGANGSGKSNFVEAFRILNATASDLAQPFLRGGGFQDWLWKGKSELGAFTLDVVAEYTIPDVGMSDILLFYSLSLGNSGQRFIVESELVGGSFRSNSPDGFFYSLVKNRPAIFQTGDTDEIVAHIVGVKMANLQLLDFDAIKYNQSILSQRNDPDLYPSLSFLNNQFSGIAVYSEANFGRLTVARRPQDAALDQTKLFEDASNLALVLNDLQNQPQVKRAIIEKLKLFYERVEDYTTRVQGGTVQIYFQEAGLTQTVPATRLSDGTLRYLCLLVLLLHPTPPPLMCIEEPELGMHPDILPTIAELLIDASQRTQLIVTTHSDMLVSAIGAKHPDAIVVCERTNKGTTMERLEPEKLAGWLKDYSLGEVWLKGAIGGTRW